MSNNAVLFLLIAVMAITGIARPVFFSPRNLLNVLGQVSVIGVLAMGTTLLMIGGQIDLSIGTALSLVAVVTASLVTSGTVPFGFAVLVGLGLGAATGAVNGLIVAKSGAQPFVITLGMMSVYQGFALLVTGGYNISNLGPGFDFLGSTRILGLALPTWVFVVTAIVVWYVLSHRVLGRYAYLIGGRRRAAYLAGVPVQKTIVIYYVANGILVAIAGILFSARIGSALPLMGSGYELQAIAAVVVGGTSLAGGIGSVTGTILGVVLLGVISNALNILRVDNYYQYILFGLIIVVAVVTYTARNKSNDR